MIKGYIFDYGATLDTAGCHWGQMLWHAYQRQQVPVTEQQFRDVRDRCSAVSDARRLPSTLQAAASADA